MVRLKDREQEEGTAAWIFQFHYGTIKSLIFFNVQIHFSLFQFHYGTIKSLTNNGKKTLRMSFQFHYGTIKRKQKL